LALLKELSHRGLNHRAHEILYCGTTTAVLRSCRKLRDVSLSYRPRL